MSDAPSAGGEVLVRVSAVDRQSWLTQGFASFDLTLASTASSPTYHGRGDRLAVDASVMLLGLESKTRYHDPRHAFAAGILKSSCPRCRVESGTHHDDSASPRQMVGERDLKATVNASKNFILLVIGRDGGGKQSLGYLTC